MFSPQSGDYNEVEDRILMRRNRIQKRIEKAKANFHQSLEQVIPDKDTEDKPDTNVSTDELDKESVSETILSQQQIAESMQILEKLLADGYDLVTNVQVAVDARLILKRSSDDDCTESRKNKLEHEAKVGAERFLEVTNKWEELFLHKVPEDLYDGLLEQRSSCDAVVEEKNKLIVYLEEELLNKEDIFSKNIHLQAQDVKMIIERMNEHVRIMKGAYKEEMRAMELAFTYERQEMLEKYLQKWNDVLEEMGSKEDKFLKDRFKLMDSCEELIDQLWKKEMEEFNNVKQKLEADIMQLELEARNLKANVLLNQEKLEYNYHVLKKRDEESTIMKSNQKRRLTKLHDIMANLKKKLETMEKHHQEENKRRMDDFKKIVNLLLDLEKKYNHFQAVDIKKYTEVWKLNEEEAKKLSRKLLKLDQTIFENHLGLEWSSPTTSFMKNVGPWGKYVSNIKYGEGKLSKYVLANEVGLAVVNDEGVEDLLLSYGESLADQVIQAESAATDSEDDTGSVPKVPLPKTTGELLAVSLTPTDDADETSPDESVSSLTGISSPPSNVYCNWNSEQYRSCRETPSSKSPCVEKEVVPIVQRILLLLCDESGFLIEDRILRLLDFLPKNSQNLIKITNIFSTLGILNEKEMNILAKYFTRYTQRFVDSTPQQPVSPEERTGSDKPTARRYSLPMKQIDKTNSTLDQGQTSRGKSSTSFPEFRSQMSRRMMRKSSWVGSTDYQESPRLQTHVELISPHDVLKALRQFVEDHRKVTRIVEKVPILYCYQLMRDKNMDELYWSQYTNVIPKEHTKLWEALIPALENFYKDLIERDKLMRDTRQLWCQNNELKRLLAEYMKSKTNAKFVIPPSHVLSMELKKLMSLSEIEETIS